MRKKRRNLLLAFVKVKSEKTLWEIIKIGVTYNKNKTSHVKEKTIFDIVIIAPLYLIFSLLMYYNELINQNILIIFLAIMVTRVAFDIYRLSSKNYEFRRGIASQRNIKTIIFYDAMVLIAVIGASFLFFSIPNSQEFISFSVFYVLLGIAILSWFRNFVLDLIFINNSKKNQ
jgi:hypothetical protein